MNLETRLNDSLNDILRSSGYIFEIINKNKKQSNLITGSNNQLIPPVVTAQLGNSINKFDDILDDVIAKFNDTKWCVEQILESKQKQEEMKLKEEEKRKEEEEKKLREEAERKREQERKRKEEEDKKRAEEQEKQRKQRLDEEAEQQRKRDAETQAAQEQANQDKNLFDDFISGDFDFNMAEFENNNENNDNNNGQNEPNPQDILSNIDYPELMGTGDKAAGSSTDKPEKLKEVDLDINNILGSNDLILDGLNMSLLDEDIVQPQTTEEDFDVDNFLNQFGND